MARVMARVLAGLMVGGAAMLVVRAMISRSRVPGVPALPPVTPQDRVALDLGSIQDLHLLDMRSQVHASKLRLQ